MRVRFLYFLIIAALLSSCIGNQKYVYLQKDDVAKDHLPIDTAVRSYTLGAFDYHIQTNDILSVRYESLSPKDFNFFSSEAQGNASSINLTSPGSALLIGEIVDDEGNIPVPVLGKVKVAGLTLFEIQDKLQKMADVYLETPIVKVRMLNYRITILGEVFKEGQVVLSNNRASLLEAVGLAGGLGELADRSKIKLIRQENSQTKVYYIDLLSEDFLNSPLYYVHQNDVMIVPPLKQRAFRKYFATNFALGISAASLILIVFSLVKNN